MAKDQIDALLDGAPAAPQQAAPQAPAAPPAGSQAASPQAPGQLQHTPEGYPYIDTGGGPPNSVGPGTQTPADAPVQDPSAPLEAAVGGVAQAGYEMKDTALSLMGGAEEPKSETRLAIEASTAALNRDPVNALASGIAQFGTAFIGLGKVLKPLAFGSQLIKEGMVADTALGGLASAAGFDPHEHALESFVQQFPSLQGPVAQYLAAKPGDESAAEGRLRNGIENLVLGGIVGPVVGTAAKGVAAGVGTIASVANPKAYVRVLTSVVRSIKLRRAGNIPAANAEMERVVPALKQAAREGAPNEATGSPVNDSGALAGEPAPGGAAAGGDGVLGDTPGSVPGGPATGSPLADGGTPGVSGPGAPAAQGAAHQGTPGQPGATLERVPPGDTVKGTQAPPQQVELTPEQVHGLINQAQKDTGAIMDAGSYEAAAAEGHAFAETDLIPWQKFATGNERIDAWMARVVDEQTAYIQKARGGNADGVMTDKAVDAMVSRLGAVAGEDPALIRGMLLQAGKDAKLMAVKMDTAFVLSQKAFQDAYGLVMRINAGNTGGLPLEAAVEVAKQRMAAAIEMFGAAKAILASGGRVVRRAQGQFNTTSLAAMEGMKANLAKMGPQDFLDLVESTKGNPQALADKVVPSTLAQVVGFSTMVAAASKVWGWSTLVAISVGNVSQLYLRPMAALIGSHYKLGQAVMAGDDALRASAAAARAQASKELILTHTMIEDGWQAAKFAFQKGQSRLAPHSTGLPVNGELQAGGTSNSRLGMGDLGQVVADWKPVQSIDDITHNVLESARVLAGEPMDTAATVAALPFRVHGAMQELIQNMRYRAVVTAKAHQEAIAMGLSPPQGGFGWATKEGQDYINHVTGRVRDSYDASGQALDLDALAEARDTTFGSKLLGRGTGDTWGGLTSTGAAIQHFAADYQAIRFVAPFIQFPSNAFRRGVQLTPGLNLLQKQYLNDLTGVNGPMAQARATGEMGLGLLFGLKAVQMRLDGKMTGAGPENPSQGSARRSQGITPYSIVSTKPDGSKSYFQIDRLEPYQAPFTYWADFADILMAGHAGDYQQAQTPVQQMADPSIQAFEAALLSTMHLLKDKTTLTNISQFMDAIQDENKLEALTNNLAPGMVVPLSSLTRMANPDPFQREVRGGSIAGFMDGIKKQLPILSTTLPVRRDFLGKPMRVPGKFANDGTDKGPLNSALEENYAATGHYPTPPSPRHGGVDLREITTEKGQNAYERYKELLDKPTAGPNLQTALEHVVSTQGYKSLTHGKPTEDGTKENVVESLLSAYHSAAMGTLRSESKTVNSSLTQRARDIMQQNMTNQKDLRAVGAAASADHFNSLLKPFGMSIPRPNTNIPPMPQGGQVPQQ